MFGTERVFCEESATEFNLGIRQTLEESRYSGSIKASCTSGWTIFSAVAAETLSDITAHKSNLPPIKVSFFDSAIFIPSVFTAGYSRQSLLGERLRNT
jgi:hypothetical protein